MVNAYTPIQHERWDACVRGLTPTMRNKANLPTRNNLPYDCRWDLSDQPGLPSATNAPQRIGWRPQ
jgi:hypothetical protein